MALENTTPATRLEEFLDRIARAAAGNVNVANIPAAPSADGTYKLTCTVTSGTPTYTWELVAQ